MRSVVQLVWFVFSVAAAFFLAWKAYELPERFAALTDLTATVLSILIGVSLALVAVLSTRPELHDVAEDPFLQHRMQNLVLRDDKLIVEGQFYLFWFYYIALGLAIIFKWLTAGSVTDFEDVTVRLIASAFVFFSSFALLLSANLPSLLRSTIRQRKELG